MMKSALLVALATAVVSTAALAVNEPKESYELKDGSTVYVFANGKMGMADKNGRVKAMKEGEVMELKDGRKLIMKDNELFLTNDFVHRDHKN